MPKEGYSSITVPIKTKKKLEKLAKGWNRSPAQQITSWCDDYA